MKRILTVTTAFVASASAALAGNVDAARIEPEVIEAAATSSDNGLIVIGILVAAVLLAGLSSSPTPLD